MSQRVEQKDDHEEIERVQRPAKKACQDRVFGVPFRFGVLSHHAATPKTESLFKRAALGLAFRRQTGSKKVRLQKTRNVIPAPPNRAKEVENANALARHSVGYCSGNHRV